MSSKLKLISLAIGAAALLSTPALASTFHGGRVSGSNGVSSAYAYAPARQSDGDNDDRGVAPQAMAVRDPTMMMIHDHIPVPDHQLPGFGSRP
jgi:hypothetical protein